MKKILFIIVLLGVSFLVGNYNPAMAKNITYSKITSGSDMPNINTVKSITTNLENILTNLGLNLEDMSSDPDSDEIFANQLLYKGEMFGTPSGERNAYNEIRYLIRIEINKPTPIKSRIAAAVQINNLRKGITILLLNVGDLSSSKLVSKVIHPSDDEIDYEPPMTHLDYPTIIRYREI